MALLTPSYIVNSAQDTTVQGEGKCVKRKRMDGSAYSNLMVNSAQDSSK
jgi:hypothetical protein